MTDTRIGRDRLTDLCDPDNFWVINTATSGIDKPKILEINIFRNELRTSEQYYIEQNSVSGTNEPYTNIIKKIYDDHKQPADKVTNTIVEDLLLNKPDYVIVNNLWWWKKTIQNNKELLGIFATLNKIPMLDLTAYEKARLASNFKIDASNHISLYDMFNWLNKCAKTAPRYISAKIPDMYEERELPDISDTRHTISQTTTEMMQLIWNDFLENDVWDENAYTV